MYKKYALNNKFPQSIFMSGYFLYRNPTYLQKRLQYCKETIKTPMGERPGGPITLHLHTAHKILNTVESKQKAKQV